MHRTRHTKQKTSATGAISGTCRPATKKKKQCTSDKEDCQKEKRAVYLQRKKEEETKAENRRCNNSP
jgi:hypothetical protein